jgi:hypothetical protein
MLDMRQLCGTRLWRVEASTVQAPIALTIDAPITCARVGGMACDSARPDIVAATVATIVTVAMTTLGAALILVSRIPNAMPAARLSRFDTTAISTADSNSMVIQLSGSRGGLTSSAKGEKRVVLFALLRLDRITFDTVERYIAAKLAEDDGSPP